MHYDIAYRFDERGAGRAGATANREARGRLRGPAADHRPRRRGD